MDEPLRFDGTQKDQYGCEIRDRIPIWKIAEIICHDEQRKLQIEWKNILEN